MDYNNQRMRFMIGYNAQYVRNTLQLQQGTNQFSEIGRIAEVHKTDWSWAPLFLDFDNDGYKDLFISNGYGRDVTDLDYGSYSAQESLDPKSTQEVRDQKQFEGFNKLPPIKLPNYFFSNNKDLTFSNVTNRVNEHEASISNGAVYVDLDNDGDLEIITSNMNGPSFVYKNLTSENTETKHNHLSIKLKQKGANPDGIGAAIEVYHSGKKQLVQQRPVRGYTSSVDYRLHLGLGSSSTVDSVLVVWPGKSLTEVFKEIKVNELNTLVKGQGAATTDVKTEEQPLFKQADLTIAKHTENEYVDFYDHPLYLKMLSREGPALAVADIDNDGKDDFIQGSAFRDTTWVYLQNNQGNFEKGTYLDNSWFHEDMGIAIFDINLDGKKDIYVGSGGNEFYEGAQRLNDRVYLQNPTGGFELDASFETDVQSTGPVSIADYDGDGDIDVFVGARFKPKAYPEAGRSKLFINENGKLVDKTDELAGGFENLGLVTAAIWTDFNNDSAADLIVVGERMSPQFYKNDNGNLRLQSFPELETRLKGLWSSIISTDIDEDGDIDYVLGNYGLNTDLKASIDEPLTLLAKDFDGNGAIDPILAHYSEGVEYPYPVRDALTSQINEMKRRFPNYESYAAVSFDNLFKDSELAGALELKATCLTSVALINESDSFKIFELPMAAQKAPLYGMVMEDFTNDSKQDLFLIGGRTDTETLSGPIDANMGTLLEGIGKLTYEALDNDKTGVNLFRKDTRSLARISTAGQLHLLIGNNDASATLLANRYPKKRIELKPTDIGVSYKLQNGKQVNVEIQLTSGYMTQHSNSLFVPKEVSSAVVEDSKGEKRVISLQ